MNDNLDTTASTRIVLLAAAITAVATLTIGVSGSGDAQVDNDQSGKGGYTVLNHPSQPCHLSVQAVANWGETSAHLPQACTYHD